MRKPVILASASPRRADILKKYSVDFIQIPSGADESGAFSVEESAMKNAEIKAEDLSGKYPDQIIIAADTVIEFQHQIIGKPADPEDAFRILKRLAGKKHLVTTGVAIHWRNNRTRIIFAELSEVTFKPLTDPEIKTYMSLVNVMDKAGAYALQEHPELLIESVVGDPENVIGLPRRAIESIRYLQTLQEKSHSNGADS